MDDGRPSWLHLFLDIPRDQWEEGCAFWAAATGWEVSPPRGEQGEFATLLPDDGDAFVKLQKIEGQPGVHLDLDGTDPAAVVRRAERLGAVPAGIEGPVPVLRSPGGFAFCATTAEEDVAGIGRSGGAVLDQICVDIPPRLWESEVAFWAELTGRRATPGRHEEFLSATDEGRLRILLQRLGDDVERVTGHPDFATADRDAETERHRSLGARVLGRHERWTVLEAPYGQVYCLTDRDPATGQ